jgi:YHS domain-containing protein
MLMQSTHWSKCYLAAACVLIAAAGCGKEEPANTDAKAQEVTTLIKEKVAEGDPQIQAAVLEKLAEVDALDGTADKIIKRCPGCGLKMDGKREHATEVSGYTIYFCSKSCQEKFTKNLTESILFLELPKP